MAYILKGETGDWEVVIGLEVHAQVVSNAKLFSGAPTAFGAEPNSQVSFIDAGMPGMLPVINEHCVAQAVKTGLGLKAKINKRSVFARKNYFYADLPQGYQISQYDQPIVGEGTIVLDMPDGSTRAIGVERLHLEQDAGKSIHDMHPQKTFIDLNRAGVGLMEIVSKPDLRSPEEAGLYLQAAHRLRYAGSVTVGRVRDGGWHEERLQVYNLLLASGEQPANQDGEVQDFQLLEAAEIARLIEDGQFTPDAAAAIGQGLLAQG